MRTILNDCILGSFARLEEHKRKGTVCSKLLICKTILEATFFASTFLVLTVIILSISVGVCV